MCLAHTVGIWLMVLAPHISADTIYGEEEGLHPVFIFGQMKKGEPMHHWLENTENGFCQFVAEARTTEKFPMVIATKYNVPIVFYKPGIGHHIHGEFYEMNLRMIKKLDKYEYMPNEVIARIETIVYNDTATGELLKRPAIMYVKYYLDIDDWDRLPLISNYHSEGSHGLKFRQRPLNKKHKKKKKTKKKHKNDKNIDGVNQRNNTKEDIEECIRKKDERREKHLKKYMNHTDPTLKYYRNTTHKPIGQ